MAVERKYERDIDLLLAEEFATNPAFADGVKSFTKFRDRNALVKEFWVSKSNNLGESDLIIVFETDDGDRFALLIEDKVDANLQPDQAGRYRLRAEQDKAANAYGDYEILLCARQHYLKSRTDLAGFDRTVSFEEMSEIIAGHTAFAPHIEPNS